MEPFAIIPAAPVLLRDVDLSETRRIVELRDSIETVLQTRADWALPVAELPPLAGLGGWGIDRGIDTRSGQYLVGSQWIEAVNTLDDAERETSRTAHPAISVALLHAHSAGVNVGPLGSSEALLIPIDLSAASAEDSPLAPVPGAKEFDAKIVAALVAGELEVFLDEVATTTAATADAAATTATAATAVPATATTTATALRVHADLELLEAAARHIRAAGRSITEFNTVFDENVHEVRSLCGIGAY